MTGGGFLIFARCAGFISRAPGFSHPSVPPAMRAGLSIVVALALAAPGTHSQCTSGASLAAMAAADFGVGAAIGFAASMLYDGAYAGGRMLDDYVGIKGSAPGAAFFAASAFGRIWSMVFLAGFFLLGGYRIVIEALAHSFDVLPACMMPSRGSLYAYALALPASIVEAALMVAGPAIALVFVAQASLGASARVIPRFSAFTLSFPVVFAIAVLVTIATIPPLFGQSATPWLRFAFLSAK